MKDREDKGDKVHPRSMTPKGILKYVSAPHLHHRGRRQKSIRERRHKQRKTTPGRWRIRAVRGNQGDKGDKGE